jgi:uncharacterized protein with HEPN domain
MARRSDAELVKDIITCIDRVEDDMRGLDLPAFPRSGMVQDAVVRNIEIIGEAVKGPSVDLRWRHVTLPWVG